MAQMVKNLPAVYKTRFQSLGQEDCLEKEMAAHSSIPAWEIPWTEEPGRLQSPGVAESDTTEQLSTAQREVWYYAVIQKASQMKYFLSTAIFYPCILTFSFTRIKI